MSHPWATATKACAVVLTLFGVVAGALPNRAFAQTETLTPAQRQAVEDAFGDYLREHPEIVIEAINILQQREQASEAADTRNVIAARGSELFNDSATPVGGNPDGDVTLVVQTVRSELVSRYNFPDTKEKTRKIGKFGASQRNLRPILL